MTVRPFWRLALGTLLSLGFLWLAVRGVAWRDVADSLATARWGFVALTSTAAVAATFLRAWCWRRIVVPGGRPVGLVRVWAVVLIGQVLNIVVLTRLGEVVRIYLIRTAAAVPLVTAASSIVVEKMFDAGAFLLFLLVLPVFLTLPAALDDARSAVALAAGLVVAAGLILAWSSGSVLAFFERTVGARDRHAGALASHVRSAADTFQIVQRWDRAFRLQAAFMLVWAIAALANYFVLLALDVDAPPIAALVVLIVLQLGLAVPSAPGKIGVFQYLCVLALQPFGVDRGEALSYGILLHVAAYGPPVVLGAVALWWELPRVRSLTLS